MPLALDPALLELVLARHVLLDELRHEVAVGTVAVRHCAEPVTLQSAVLQLILSRQGFALAGDLRDEDRVLIDLGLPGAAHVASHRVDAILLHHKAAWRRLVTR